MITKKRSVLIIAIIITLIMSTTVYAAPSSWSEDFIKSNLLEDLSPEALLTSNNLQQYITREEFAELTVTLYSKATGTDGEDLVQWNPFYDTTNESVAKAFNLGIVSGTGRDGSDRLLFSPKSRVTRQEIAVMLVKALDILGIDVTSKDKMYYDDEALISNWAYNSVSFASENGILSGVGNNKVAPTENATREQALVLINKIAMKYGWISNKTTAPLFNDTNAKSAYGFSVPFYHTTQLRAYETEQGVAFAISHLYDSYIIDINKQKDNLINILLNSKTIAYDAFVNTRNRIIKCYDSSSKKFIPVETVYIDVSTGNVYYSAIKTSYVKISVDTEFLLEYVNK